LFAAFVAASLRRAAAAGGAIGGVDVDSVALP
jgi:hypothetical protein